MSNTTTPIKLTNDITFIREMIDGAVKRNTLVWVVFYFPNSKSHGIMRGRAGLSITDESLYKVRAEDGLSEVCFQLSDIQSLCGNTIILR